MMSDTEYTERMSTLAVRGISEGRWIRIRHVPVGGFTVDVREREFATAGEGELAREVLSALRDLRRDHGRRVRELHEQRFGPDLGLVG